MTHRELTNEYDTLELEVLDALDQARCAIFNGKQYPRIANMRLAITGSKQMCEYENDLLPKAKAREASEQHTPCNNPPANQAIENTANDGGAPQQQKNHSSPGACPGGGGDFEARRS